LVEREREDAPVDDLVQLLAVGVGGRGVEVSEVDLEVVLEFGRRRERRQAQVEQLPALGFALPACEITRRVVSPNIVADVG
jgi:hypothetical protein